MGPSEEGPRSLVGSAGGMLGGMADVTRILSAIEAGDPHAADELLPFVYDELRKLAARRLARERPGQTLQATALVHEAYLRLVGPGAEPRWDDRRHFFAAAAEAMRRILVEAAWHYRHPPRRSVAIQARWRGQPKTVIDHAWKAQERLHRRHFRLTSRGKPSQVATVAVARELCGFIWAIARA